MRELFLEPAAELLSLVLYTLLAVGLTGAGVAVEQVSLMRLATGLDPLGLWFAYMGALLPYAGTYLVGYGKLRPLVRDRLPPTDGADAS